MNPHKDKRIGVVYYTREFLEGHAEACQKLYSKIIPYKIEFDPLNEIYKVHAVSKHFDPIHEGDTIPKYDATFSKDHHDLKIKLKRKYDKSSVSHKYKRIA